MSQKRIVRLLSGFAAGFVSVLTFHQAVVALLYGIRFTYPMHPTHPLGIPQIVSSAFWGGVWGIVVSMLTVGTGTRQAIRYWITVALSSGVVVTAVFLFFVMPVYSQLFLLSQGQDRDAVVFAWPQNFFAFQFMVNSAWGVGTALLLQWLPTGDQ